MELHNKYEDNNTYTWNHTINMKINNTYTLHNKYEDK